MVNSGRNTTTGKAASGDYGPLLFFLCLFVRFLVSLPIIPGKKGADFIPFLGDYQLCWELHI